MPQLILRVVACSHVQGYISPWCPISGNWLPCWRRYQDADGDLHNQSWNKDGYATIRYRTIGRYFEIVQDYDTLIIAKLYCLRGNRVRQLRELNIFSANFSHFSSVFCIPTYPANSPIRVRQVAEKNCIYTIEETIPHPHQMPVNVESIIISGFVVLTGLPTL